MAERGRATAALFWSGQAWGTGVSQSSDAGMSQIQIRQAPVSVLSSVLPHLDFACPQEYSSFGVTKAEDKQKLFRVIKAVNQDWKEDQEGNKQPLQLPPAPPVGNLGQARDSPVAEVIFHVVQNMSYSRPLPGITNQYLTLLRVDAS